MSEYFKGVTFANQNVSPVDDAVLRRRLLSDGVLTGCALTYAGYTLTMAAGYLIACGRQIRRPTAENWAISDATSGYARVLMTVDLTRTSTEEVFDQVNTSIEYATSSDGFPALIQDDINATGSKYQLVLAVVSLGIGGITGIVRKLSASKTWGSSHNLLDNSDFRKPVNQRGLNSYAGFAYTIDRWKIYQTTLDVENGYIRTPETFQYLENYDASKTYTLAAKDIDGNIAVVSGKFIDADVKKSVGNLTVRMTITDELAIVIVSATDKTTPVNLVWAALYEGEYTAATLPEYRPKGYGAELAECQRYFLPKLGQFEAGIMTSENVAGFHIKTPVSMRALPQIGVNILDNAITYTGTIASRTINAVTAISSLHLKQDGVIIEVRLAGNATFQSPAILYGADFYFVADL